MKEGTEKIYPNASLLILDRDSLRRAKFQRETVAVGFATRFEWGVVFLRWGWGKTKGPSENSGGGQKGGFAFEKEGTVCSPLGIAE